MKGYQKITVIDGGSKEVGVVTAKFSGTVVGTTHFSSFVPAGFRTMFWFFIFFDYFCKHKPSLLIFEEVAMAGDKIGATKKVLKCLGAIEAAWGAYLSVVDKEPVEPISLSTMTARKEVLGDGRAGKEEIALYCKDSLGYEDLSQHEYDAMLLLELFLIQNKKAIRRLYSAHNL